MKKVCVIITKLELGGAQKVALYCAGSLNKENFETFIISGMGGYLDREVFGKFKIYQLNNLIRKISIVKDFKALIDIYSILKKEKPDIVHTHSSKAGILGRIAAKLAGIKFIVHTIHGYGFNDTQNILIKYFYIFLEKFCAKFSNKLIAVSKKDIETGVKYKIAKEENFVLIRAGIDTEFYKNYIPKLELKKSLNISENKKLVTMVAPFKPQKNIFDFVCACKIVAEKNPDVFFVLVGDGTQRKDIESLIKKLGLEKNFFLLGWRTDIAEILKSSDIFVLTSLWEGLPCSIIEAMCCGKPVVANNVGGVNEVVKDGKTGFLIEKLDYRLTAQKINILLENVQLSKSFSENAKNFITQEFNIDFNTRQHEELYNSASKSRNLYS
jgi:glycosyltransferase involved in cell wall biosynthesis